MTQDGRTPPSPDSHRQTLDRQEAAALLRAAKTVRDWDARAIDGLTAAARAIERARQGGGPSAVECETTRFFGHFVGDPQKYRDKGEVAQHRATMDCLAIFRERVTSEGWLEHAQLDAVDAEVMDLIERAVDEAKASPLPDMSEITTDVYASY